MCPKTILPHKQSVANMIKNNIREINEPPPPHHLFPEHPIQMLLTKYSDERKPIPGDTDLDFYKLKIFLNNLLNVAEKYYCAWYVSLENIVEKKKTRSSPRKLSLFPTIIKNLPFVWLLIHGIVLHWSSYKSDCLCNLFPKQSLVCTCLH